MPPIMLDCALCKKSFIKRHWKHIHCSRECADKTHSIRMKGKGNPHFKDGKSHAKWFDDMRPIILERDGWKCRGCGIGESWKSRKIKATSVQVSNFAIHHIDHDTKDNSPKNLVILCLSCHTIHHKSHETPYPGLSEYAIQATESMTSKLKERATSLEMAYCPTIASLLMIQ